MARLRARAMGADLASECLALGPERRTPIGRIQLRREEQAAANDQAVPQLVQVNGPPVAAIRVSNAREKRATRTTAFDLDQGVRRRQSVFRPPNDVA